MNVYLPAQPAPPPAPDTLFADGEPAFARAPARVVLTSPERPPISGLVEIGVSLAPARPRGGAVGVGGAMGADVAPDALEEAVRRGGVFGLPGRVWRRAHQVLP